MGNSEAIVCGTCARTYKWKPELAGKRAKCKCGSKVEFPAELAALPDIDLLDQPPIAGNAGGEYDLHEPIAPALQAPPARPVPPAPPVRAGAAPGCKGCGQKMDAGALLCTTCGMNQKTGKKLGTAVERPSVLAAADLPEAKPAGDKTKWLWMGGLGVAAVGLVLVGMFVFPEAGARIFAGIGITGAVIWAIGTIWAIYVATADNIGLRLLCRFVPVVGLIVVIMRAVSDWEEMKGAVLTMLTGLGLGIVGLVMWMGTVGHAP